MTDNLAVESTDYDAFSIPVPADPRLPGGGGTVLAGLYDVSAAKFGQINNLVTRRAATGRRPSGGTASTSASTRGCAA